MWTAAQVSELSFPVDGHQRCLQIEDGSFWFEHRNECIAEVVKRWPPPGTLLDVGGGNGYVTRRLLDEGFDTVLLEPGRDGAENAYKHRAIPRVVCSTIEQAGFPPGSFGAIGVFDVVEHIEDDSAFLQALHALIVPGGFIYGTVPAHSWLWSASDAVAGHFRRYTADSIVRLLGESFEHELVTYFFAPLLLPVLIGRVLPYRLGFRSKLVMSPTTEHGNQGGLASSLIRFLLAGEAHNIARGGHSRIGASLLFVGRKR